MTVWVVVSISCYDCGGTATVRVLSREPTSDEVDALRYTRGTCARTRVVLATVDGEPALSKEEP
jgi:hypothetical protein